MKSIQQADMDDSVQSVLRVCNGYEIEFIANILSGAFLNAVALASAQRNNGTTKSNDVVHWGFFFIEAIAVQTREAAAQIEATKR